jgi:NAD(P)-dependent dehydrogenase (short-subunit alcohol dehydrogenase family)
LQRSPGGSSGIGLATAKRFQQVGARVAISGRNQKSLDDAVQEFGAVVLAVRSDVSKLSDLDILFDIVSKKLGPFDVLFANARIAKFAWVSDVSGDVSDQTFDSNVKGVFFTVQEAIPFLNENASAILNTSFVNRPAFPQPAPTQRVKQRCAHWPGASLQNSQQEESV